jgi:uncharacterized protein YkwD
MEETIHQARNYRHRNHGINSLGYDDFLSSIALQYSREMTHPGYFTYSFPKGEAPGEIY